MTDNTNQKILPEFLEKINKLYPDIQPIPTDIKSPVDYQYYDISSTSSGINVYFHNMTYKEILRMIDNKFDDYSENIKEYFNLIKLYNQLLYNINVDTFNISLSIMNNFNDDDNGLFKFKAINQKPDGLLIIFNYLSYIEDKDSGMYTTSLENKDGYKYLAEILTHKLNSYIDSSDICFYNLKSYVDLINILKH